MAHNPIDRAVAEESALDSLTRRLWGRQRRVTGSTLEAAIKSGRGGIVTQSDDWLDAIDVAISDTRQVQTAVLTRAYEDGFIQVSDALVDRAADLAARDAGKRAVTLIRDVERKTRRNIHRLVRRAAREFVRDPGPMHLEALEQAIRQMIGLTEYQARTIQRWEDLARKAGVPETKILQEIRRRTRAALDRRAAAIADRAIVEAVNFGLFNAWRNAEESGDLPFGTMKLWRHQGDARVRPRHRRQTEVGPIPLGDIFALHGVLYPPSPDYGCRCWVELVIPSEPRITIAERLESIPIAQIDRVRPPIN